MKGECPFGAKCETCVLFRKGLRIFEDGRKPEPVEECAINIGVDCLENLVSRSIGQQKATEQTRNEVVNLHQTFFDIARMKRIETNEGRQISD